MDIHAVVEEKLNNDSDFQASLADLPEEDREQAINTKRSELINAEFQSERQKALENEQKFNDQKRRAEKAEEESKKPKVETKETGITAKDVLILSGEGITHEEDVSRAEWWAKANGITVGEAIKDPNLRLIISNQKEMRQTALATNKGGGASGVSKESPDAVISKARKGQDPSSDEGIEALVAAETALKFAKIRK